MPDGAYSKSGHSVRMVVLARPREGTTGTLSAFTRLFPYQRVDTANVLCFAVALR